LLLIWCYVCDWYTPVNVVDYEGGTWGPCEMCGSPLYFYWQH